MRKVLAEMQGHSDRRARFRTAIALILGNEEHLFEGKVEGEILTARQGSAGFGYDPVFRPDGYDRSFAEMDPDTKNSISHRGEATRKLAAFLNATEQ